MTESPPSTLACLLDERAEALAHAWLPRLREGVPAGGRVELEDALASLLGALTEALRTGGDGPLTTHLPSPRAGFDLPELAREYGVLRALVLELAGEAGTPPTDAERRVLTGFFTAAITEAAAPHARARQQELVEKARASAEELRLVTDALPVLISVVTADERYGLVNKAYEEWFGIPRGEMLGRTIREVLGETAYAVMSQYVRRGLSGEHYSFEQHGVPYRLGGTRDVKVTMVPYVDTAGTRSGYVALLEDITQQRRLAEERDRLARQRTEVLESMGDGFFALDSEYRFTLMNRHHERWTQSTREATLGRVLWEVFPGTADPGLKYWTSYRRCMEERVPVRFVDYYAPLDLWTEVRAYPTADGGIAVFFRDVSREKRTEEALKRQSEFEQQLIGIVSHDLRNPLSAIRMSATVIQRGEHLDAAGHRSVARIQSATDRAIRLVEDLLDFTQARLGGGIPITRRPLDIHDALRGVLEELRSAYPERDVELDARGDGRGEWDGDRVTQIVQNLATNALKYSPEGTPVRLLVSGTHDAVELAVHNLGAPIAPAQLERLFQPMQRGAEQRTNASRSVGLGLYIVKQLVDAHAGTLTVTSDAESGTTFTVRLPRHA